MRSGVCSVLRLFRRIVDDPFYNIRNSLVAAIVLQKSKTKRRKTERRISKRRIAKRRIAKWLLVLNYSGLASLGLTLQIYTIPKRVGNLMTRLSATCFSHICACEIIS
jgi:hypothetical protein